jgi:hypothetical protein
MVLGRNSWELLEMFLMPIDNLTTWLKIQYAQDLFIIDKGRLHTSFVLPYFKTKEYKCRK